MKIQLINNGSITLTSPTGESIEVDKPYVNFKDDRALDWAINNNLSCNLLEVLNHIPIGTVVSIKGYEGVLKLDTSYKDLTYLNDNPVGKGIMLRWVPLIETIYALQVQEPWFRGDLDTEFPFKLLLSKKAKEVLYGEGILMINIMRVIKSNAELDVSLPYRLPEPFSFIRKLELCT